MLPATANTGFAEIAFMTFETGSICQFGNREKLMIFILDAAHSPPRLIAGFALSVLTDNNVGLGYCYALS
jgi:hypothetical protein